MRDIPRVTFLVIIDAFAVAMLVVLLSGCVTTPAKYRDRTGDFVSNVASAAGTIPPALPGMEIAGTGSPACMPTTNAVNQLTSGSGYALFHGAFDNPRTARSIERQVSERALMHASR